ncbi:hypothetical protein PR202_ga28699 [Eleusine coracana subsp. coracana]|uniref:V-SNARE coiled-coil homology domain-containing protein n=1 Tax=Eleusine coracana subsp. coracana TaxID=191504 RepID=A0AAV5DJ96_ELECO|nr:hypothetical protein PR202_ga28699 [Eleusine coracana subsp. coracana]
MFAKRLLHKALHHHHHQVRNFTPPTADCSRLVPLTSDSFHVSDCQGGGAPGGEAADVPHMEAQVALHYGVPYTASLLAFDPVQRLLAVATLDGRIKVFGGDHIEGLLISPNSVPYKFLQFIQNQGLLIAISNDNEIQVWNLEFRQLFYSSQWDANITAFAVIEGTFLMYLGDENGLLSVLKYDMDDGKLQKMPYNIPIQSIAEADGISLLDPQPIVGILPQPDTFGTRVLIAFEKGLLVLWDVSEDHAICVRGFGDLHMKDQVPGAQRDAGEDKLDNTTEESEEEREICSLCWASKGGSIVAVGYITGDILLWDMTTRSSRQDKQSDVSSNVVKLQLASGNRRLPVIILHWSNGSGGDTHRGGHLFVYGGDDMGSEEVLTKFHGKPNTTPFISGNMKWPLTGGVPSEMSLNEGHDVERLYIAGYQDGSVRIWDATFPVLMPMFVLDGKVAEVNLDGANAAVSSLAFCSSNMTLAVGTTSGLVRIYKLREHTGGSSFHFVAMFDTSQTSIMFSGDCASGTNSPVVSLSIYSVAASAANADQSKKGTPQNGALHQKQTQISEDKSPNQGKTGKESNDLDEKEAQEVDKHPKNASQLPRDGDFESLLLVCFEDVLLLYSLASLSQGSTKHLHKMKLAKPCCWTAIFKDMDGKICGLILAYQTGTIELRSVPDLALVAECSLMSLLRWSYKTGMDKSTSTSNGQIALVNGSEFGIISLIASENDFRIPESLPCLHDKVLAAAAEAAISFSIDQRRKNPAAGLLGGIIKGIKGKAEEPAEMKGTFSAQSPSELLESIFLKESFVQPSRPTPDDSIEELSIDDIDIDDDVPLAPASSSTSHVNKKTTVEEEREKLFEGSSNAEKPRMRTPQEILTKYKFGGDAAAAAAHAKDKLMQRQEKLERISQQTAELQNGAENFASLAQELAKTMENKKWWKL